MSYTSSDVSKLTKLYLLNYLRFQPGGVLPCSSKLNVARKVFTELLHVSFVDTCFTPTVLISDMHAQAMIHVEQFMKMSQMNMLERVRDIGIKNLPESPIDLKTYWQPEFVMCDGH